jgi:acetyl esterase/lipase
VTTPIHPELRGRARFLPRVAVGKRSLPLARAGMSLLARRRADGVEVEPVGDISVRVHRPGGDGDPADHGPLPALLWIHGGGMVIGTPVQDDDLCRSFARSAGCLVGAVGYRLAPEHPFPTPLEDCYDALVWLMGRSDVDTSRVAIGGASAGGGLAAGLALLARERGLATPALQLLVYPMLDDRTVVRTDIDERNMRLWNNKSNAFGWGAYTGQPPGSPDVSPLAAPARSDDLSGLPPAWIGVGTNDLFYNEDVAYAGRLEAAGVPCDLEVVDGAFHGFDGVCAKAEVSRRFHQAQVHALSEALAP